MTWRVRLARVLQNVRAVFSWFEPFMVAFCVVMALSISGVVVDILHGGPYPALFVAIVTLSTVASWPMFLLLVATSTGLFTETAFRFPNTPTRAELEYQIELLQTRLDEYERPHATTSGHRTTYNPHTVERR